MYTIFTKKPGAPKGVVHKVWLIMRLTAAILLTTLMQISAATFGQKLTMHQSKASLKEVFKEIKDQTGYNVFWKSEQLQNAKTVEANFENMEIEKVLNMVLAEQNLSYVMEDKTIIIREKKSALPKQEVSEMDLIDVSGRVVTSDGKGIPFATVKIKGTSEKTAKATPKNRVTSSDREGKFFMRGIEEGSILVVSSVGYFTREIKAKSKMGNIVLQPTNAELDEVGVQGTRQVGVKVDITNKAHMSLAQVLEGGIPGVAIRRGTTTIQGESTISYNGVERTLREEYEYRRSKNYFETRRYPTFEEFETAINNGSLKLPSIRESSISTSPYTRNEDVPTIQSNSTTIPNGIVIEQRGASSFNGETTNMLLVVDGFAQRELDPNFPMNNVVSVEVIRDPVECLKWGPEGAQGVIIITTNLPKPGELSVSYNSNFYFTPPQDISASSLRLASTADVLDYYQDAYNKNLTNYIKKGGKLDSLALPARISPAEALLFYRDKKFITEQAFQYKWDSLSMLNNRDQIQRLLQRNGFNQNQSLAISGGTNAYRFVLSGNYGTQRSTSIGASGNSYALNLKNDFNLLNNKLIINWITNVNGQRRKSASVNFGDNLDPYQMLLGGQNEYIYSYTNVTPERNAEMLRAGYLENGINILENARNTSTIDKTFDINSNLNADWQLTKDIKWSTSTTFRQLGGNKDAWAGMESSQVRAIINKYGSPQATGVDFYVPWGDTFTNTRRKSLGYKLRSGFTFDRVYGEVHSVSAGVDAALSNNQNRSTPGVTLYGYDLNTGSSLPFLTLGDPNIQNYSGQSFQIEPLLVPDQESITYNRSINLNGRLSYSYMNRYGLSASYNSTAVPDRTRRSPFNTTSSRSLSAFWGINNESFFNVSWISKLKFTVNGNNTKVAQLPAGVIEGTRYLQPLWDNSTIVVNGVTQSQLNGQNNYRLSGNLDAGFSQDRLLFNIGYTVNSRGTTQWNGRLSYDIASEPYFKIPFISSLRTDLLLQDLNPFQGLEVIMTANSLSSGGGFGAQGNGVGTNSGILPAAVLNKEARLFIGLADDRFSMDMRYYNKRTSGLSNGFVPPDESTGLASQLNFSKLSNTGFELGLQAEIIKNKNFQWIMNLNGAYNQNKVLSAPRVNFSFSSGYLTSQRSGYSKDNLWNFKWAGLDNEGNPQVYNKNMEKVSSADSVKMSQLDAAALVYVGRTIPPYTGGISQQFYYKDFFLNARFIFNFGHVMRDYKPSLDGKFDKSIAIRDRWRNPGDEAFTDIAGIAPSDTERDLLIAGSDNGVLPADNVRFREIQIGYNVPAKVLKSNFIKGLGISMQVQNVALWVRNKKGLDPEVVSNAGVIRSRQPRSFIMTLNMNF